MRSRLLFISALMSSAAIIPGLALAQDPEGTDNGEIEELLVQGQYIPEPKRETSQVATFLDEEALKRAGDDTAALALRRLTGLSLVSDKFIYVRGLGERYANVTLNGATLPSPEPLRRVAPLDIFPAAVLGGASVQKTYSADLPGEFGGGLVKLETPTTPAERFLTISADVGYDSETTFKNGLFYDGGDSFPMGINNGARDIPDPLAEAFATGNRINESNFSSTQLQNIGRSLENSKLWVLFDGNVSPSGSANISAGDSFYAGDVEIGVLGSAGWSSDWDTKRGERDTASIGADADGNDVLLRRDDLDRFSTENEVRFHGMGNLGAYIDGHSLRLTGIYLKTTTKEARIISGFSDRDGANIRQDFLEWFDREMGSLQLTGEHDMLDDRLHITWNANYAESSRDAPYDRDVRYIENADGNLVYDDRRGRNLTRFSTVEDEVMGWQGKIAYDIPLSDMVTATPYAGYQRNETKRAALQRDFRLLERGAGLPAELLGQRIDYIFADQNINPNRLVLIETTGATADPAYDGELDFEGFFGGMSLALGDNWRIDGGVRVEDAILIVDTFDFFSEDEDIETNIDERDVLPAATITWTFYDNMQLRGGYSETISRPQFRELAFSQFLNVDTDQSFIGNPHLVSSDIENFDLRWEWYFGTNEYLTIGGFYKKMMNPIEETINASGDIQLTSFQNAPRADLKGVEVEFTKYFRLDGFLGMENFFSTKEFLISTNYTYTDSELKVKDDDTVIRPNGSVIDANFIIEDGRRLQGQSDHVVNFEFGYADSEARSQATILVNWVSKRIRELGVQSLPPVYVYDPVSVDFRYVRTIEAWSQDFDFSLSVRNILGDEHKATQSLDGNSVNVDYYELGRSVSLGLSTTF